MGRRMEWYAGAVALGFLLAGCGGDSSTAPTTPPPPKPLAFLKVARDSIAFAAVQGGSSPAAQTIAITDSGAPLTGLTVSPATYGSGATGWLHATLDKTTAPATLTLSAVTGTLTAGRYTATVNIAASETALGSPRTIRLSFLVLADANLTMLPSHGQTAAFLDAPSFSTQLAMSPGARYLIAVVNTNPSYTITEDFVLAGAIMGAPATAVASDVAMAGVAQQPTRETPYAGPPLHLARGADRTARLRLPRLAQNHLATLDANRRAYARRASLQRGRARVSAAGRRIAPFASAIASTIGTVNRVYVGNTLSGGCAEVDSIGARTVAVGQHVIVLADTNTTTWPQAQRPDSSFYQAFADEFDQITWPHTQTYVGDPLAYDASLSHAGKVTVTITPVLNNLGGGVVAYVSLCDFFPFVGSGADANYSNETEMVYSWTPFANGFDVATWQKQMRATVAHETKHVVSLAARITNNSPVLEEVWLEEGTAQQSEEIWLRHFNNTTWKGYANFFQTIACEINLGNGAPCNLADDKPIGLALSHLPFLFDYLMGESRNAQGLGKDAAAIYGAGWALTRWATDQYATNEASFARSLVNEPALSGLSNLSSHTGQPTPLLLMYWNLATAIFQGTPVHAVADQRIITPSFNFWDIFRVAQTELTCGGQRCGFFTQSGTPVWPLQPTALTAGAFSRSVTGVPGTAASFFVLTAPWGGGQQALQLAGGSGGPISPASGLRVGIVRLE